MWSCQEEEEDVKSIGGVVDEDEDDGTETDSCLKDPDWTLSMASDADSDSLNSSILSSLIPSTPTPLKPRTQAP